MEPEPFSWSNPVPMYGPKGWTGSYVAALSPYAGPRERDHCRYAGIPHCEVVTILDELPALALEAVDTDLTTAICSVVADHSDDVTWTAVIYDATRHDERIEFPMAHCDVTGWPTATIKALIERARNHQVDSLYQHGPGFARLLLG